MLTTIQDATKQYLPAKKKTSSSGWISFNAVCCEHNGESRDTRGRGGVITNPNGSISYSCFNCGFKANYTPGRHLNYKFRKFLSWLGADENSIKRLVIDAIRIKELVIPDEQTSDEEAELSFAPRPLPIGAKSFSEWRTFLALTDDNYITPESLKRSVEYVDRRGGNLLGRYEFYSSEDTEHNMHKRVIVPCYWKGQLIGSTSRTFEDGIKPKYYADYEPNYVFNIDKQTPEKKFVVVTEGPFDAMAIDGVAVLSNECSEIQADIIDSLGKEVIVVPDFDIKVVKGRSVWAGSKLVEQAIEYGWAVSFPVWNEKCKDTSEAVAQYGKLFVLKSIIEAKETSRLKIELLRKRYNS